MGEELTDRDGQTLFEICTPADHEARHRRITAGDLERLDVLEDAGLVRTERSGRYKFHYLDTTPLNEIAERWPLPREEQDR